MFNIALYEPEIPPNTGNIMRLCVNTNTALHLIHPLTFSLDEKSLRRAGMDFRDKATTLEYENYPAFLETSGLGNIYALTTKGSRAHTDVTFQDNDVFLFGPESRGLPDSVLEQFPNDRKIRVPIMPDSRSLNLSNTVAIVLYEALRQHDFPGLG